MCDDEIVLRAQGGDVVLGAEIVAFAEAVVVVVGDGSGLVEEPGNAVVGNVVRLLIEIAERKAGGGAQAEGEGGRHAVAAVEGDVAAGDSALGSHHVHAEGGALTQGGDGEVDVGGGAAGAIGAAIEGAGEGAQQVGHFGGLVDDAAGGTAAEGGRGGSLHDVDFLQIEGIAVVAAEIAHAIDVQIVARAEAANGQIVALRAAFAGGDADARDVAQGIAECGGVLLRHDLLADDVHGLRGIADGFGVLGDGGRQGGGGGGDVHSFGHAVELQYYASWLPVKRKWTPVFLSICSSACDGVRTPETPGVASWPMPSLVMPTSRLVALRKTWAASWSVPAGISKRCGGSAAAAWNANRAGRVRNGWRGAASTLWQPMAV